MKFHHFIKMIISMLKNRTVPFSFYTANGVGSDVFIRKIGARRKLFNQIGSSVYTNDLKRALLIKVFRRRRIQLSDTASGLHARLDFCMEHRTVASLKVS